MTTTEEIIRTLVKGMDRFLNLFGTSNELSGLVKVGIETRLEPIFFGKHATYNIPKQGHDKLKILLQDIQVAAFLMYCIL